MQSFSAAPYCLNNLDPVTVFKLTLAMQTCWHQFTVTLHRDPFSGQPKDLKKAGNRGIGRELARFAINLNIHVFIVPRGRRPGDADQTPNL
jgi:hypothetical protein